MAFISAKNVKHRFLRRDEEGQVIGEIAALDGVDLELAAGQFIAILGHNGSGKSTFAKHINALLTPSEGTLLVDGKNVSDESQLWNIRQTAGMVFQNPDNQIVAGVVEEDVAFGPENMGIPSEEICRRVDESLEAVAMTEYRRHSPNRLSGGQKQRVAVAGVVAMRPKCILLDEATAMLDPNGRAEVLKTVHRLNKEEGVTVLLITHHMEEAVDADAVFVLDRGKVVLQGTPREIFAQVEALEALGLDVPQVTRLAYELKKEGLPLPAAVLNRRELVESLGEILKKKSAVKDSEERKVQVTQPATGAEKLRLANVSYTYGAGTAYERQALKDCSLTVYDGELIGIIGHTGSGKSTLIQLFNGLLSPTAGAVLYEGENIADASFSKRTLRGKVGLVFQYAEYQPFEATVLEVVAFGPKNQGATQEEALEKARAALRQVGLAESTWDQSPFELSGGQKRRAALAGVLAMEPEVLVLDEPTAGLDPRGRDELFALIERLHKERHMSILIVSHSMEDVAAHVERIVVLNHAKLMLSGTPAEVFSHTKELEAACLAAPQVAYVCSDLKAKGLPIKKVATTVEEAKEEILRLC